MQTMLPHPYDKNAQGVAIEDGAPVAEVTTGAAQADAIRATPGGYPFRWRLRVREA